EGLVCEHSQIFSRAQLGFTDFTDEERARFKPVRQSLVRVHPGTGRKSIYLSSHAGTILGWPIPEARLFLRDLVEHATQREFVYAHKWRGGGPGVVGKPPAQPPPPPLSGRRTPASPCSAPGRFRSTTRATCAARRSGATVPPSLRPPRSFRERGRRPGAGRPRCAASHSLAAAAGRRRSTASRRAWP